MRHLQARQLIYQLRYRLWQPLDQPGKEYPKVSPLTVELPKGKTCGSEKNISAIAQPTLLGAAHFRFLNVAHDFGEPEAIDWEYEAQGKLWTYNLNYFEFLRQPSVDFSVGQELIDCWINQSNHIRQAWEPYPLSLRIVHWLCFYREQQRTPPEEVKRSLYRQYRALWQKREFHLGANHLLENAMALFVGAWYFQEEARLTQAVDFLDQQLQEQYLPEGAHYELSPMYHCILLWRLLDVYSLVFAESPAQPLPEKLRAFKPKLYANLQRQLGWLQAMVDDRGQYPHFNDSTDGIAPEPGDLLEYGGCLEISPEIPAHPFPYRKYHWGSASLWIDLAAVGPHEQPGHAHADNLHFCLTDNGQPIIVDTSVSTYEKNAQRLWERATAAHNTVSVAGKDSSEIWGGFRCGRRAKTRVITDENGRLVAEHNGYRQLGKTHQRSFQWEGGRLQIKDRIAGKATARLYFHPDLDPIRNEQNEVVIGAYTIQYSGELAGEIQGYEYAAGFNKLRPGYCLVIDFENDLTVTLRKT